MLGALVVLCPWAVRNQLQFGRPICTTTHGGFTLLLANNPDFYQWLRQGRWGDVWRADHFNADWNARKPSNEIAADRMAYSEGWRNIRREPTMFLYACAVRMGRFWSPLPHRVVPNETPLHRLSRYAVAVWYVAEFLLAALGAWRVFWGEERRAGDEGNDECEMMNELQTRQPDLYHSSFRIHYSRCWLWGLLLAGCLTAVHTVFWTDMRMRAPLMPVVALAAAAWMSTASHRRDCQDCGSRLAWNTPSSTTNPSSTT